MRSVKVRDLHSLIFQMMGFTVSCAESGWRCWLVSMFSPSFIGQMNLITFVSKGSFTLDHIGQKTATRVGLNFLVCCTSLFRLVMSQQVLYLEITIVMNVVLSALKKQDTCFMYDRKCNTLETYTAAVSAYCRFLCIYPLTKLFGYFLWLTVLLFYSFFTSSETKCLWNCLMSLPVEEIRYKDQTKCLASCSHLSAL